MTTNELKRRLPNSSGDFLRLNAEAGKADIQPNDTGTPAKLERDARDGALGKIPVQKTVSGQFRIRVTTIRKNLLDDDNCCEKFHVDLLRYASGGLLGDSRKTTRIEVCQQKAQAGEREEVRLEVFEL